MRSRWPRRALALGAILCLAVAADAALLEPRWLEVTEHDVGQGPREVRVVHLTDLHLDGFGSYERSVLDAVRALRPDLIVLTGDSLSARTATPEVRAAVTGFLRALRELAPPLGVLACAGNHEDWAGPWAFACYAEAGVPVLGVGDPPRVLLDGRLTVSGAQAARAPLRAAGPGFDVLLCHYPGVFPHAAAAGYELVLAGHTHGGQVRLPGIGPLWLPRDCGPYVEGCYRDHGSTLYVSRGVGTSVLPLRFCCRPEVALVRVHL